MLNPGRHSPFHGDPVKLKLNFPRFFFSEGNLQRKKEPQVFWYTCSWVKVDWMSGGSQNFEYQLPLIRWVEACVAYGYQNRYQKQLSWVYRGWDDIYIFQRGVNLIKVARIITLSRTPSKAPLPNMLILISPAALFVYSYKVQRPNFAHINHPNPTYAGWALWLIKRQLVDFRTSFFT